LAKADVTKLKVVAAQDVYMNENATVLVLLFDNMIRGTSIR